MQILSSSVVGATKEEGENEEDADSQPPAPTSAEQAEEASKRYMYIVKT